MKGFLALLLGLTLPLPIQGCYTVLRSPRVSLERQQDAEVGSPNRSSVEGIVEYVEGGGTREAYYPEGFVLTRCDWIRNAPRYSGEVYLVGPVDSSFINKDVHIEGRIKLMPHPTHRPDGTPDYTSMMYLYIDTIELVK